MTKPLLGTGIDRLQATRVHQLATEYNLVVVVSFERLGLWSCAEDLDQAVGDHLVLAVLELPDSKSEAVRIARMAMMAAVIVTGRRVRIASAHSAGTGAHAANTRSAGCPPVSA